MPSSLTSSDSRSEPADSSGAKKTRGAPPAKTKKRKPKWVVDEAAFNKLLDCFAPDRSEAIVLYDRAYRKVLRYFEWRSVVTADECADETLDRVARRISEGQKINKLMPYIFVTARHIHQEVIKARNERPEIPVDEVQPKYLVIAEREIVDPDVRLICFDHCLEELEPDDRALVLGYYEGEGREKIDNRQELAKKRKTTLNALRILVHRIKRTLEDCIAECLKTEAARNG